MALIGTIELEKASRAATLHAIEGVGYHSV
jgi:hypothetical protein